MFIHSVKHVYWLIAILLLDENINKKQEKATQQQQQQQEQQPKWNKKIILMWEYDSQWEWTPIMNMSSNSFGLLSFGGGIMICNWIGPPF